MVRLLQNDFEFAWKRLLNPKTGSMNATEIFLLGAYNTGKGEEGQVGIQVVDHQTLKVTLEHQLLLLNKTSKLTIYSIS